MKTALVMMALLLPPGLLAQPGALSQSQPLVFTHVTVVDVSAEDVKRALWLDQTVIIDGARIAAVGRTGEVRIPRGTQVIDASGKFLMPGLWDMHVHITDWEIEAALNLFLANGVTGVRDMGGSLTPILALRQEIASGSRLGPRMVVAGPEINGLVGSGDARRYLTAEEARQEVRRRQLAGVDFIKTYSYLSHEAFFAVMDEAKNLGLVVAGHLPYAVRAADAARAGLKSIEHGEGETIDATDLEESLREEIRLRIEGKTEGIGVPQISIDQADRRRNSFNLRKLEELSAVYVENGTWHCPTFVVPEVVARHNRRLRTGITRIPYLRYVPRTVQDDWSGNISGSSEDRIRRLNVHADFKRVLAAAMHRAGVRFLAGSDTPVVGQVPGFSLHDELAILAEMGFSPLEALQTATINPARFFGRENELGTVAPGRLADLVLLDANPLDDIANTRRIDAVIANGTYLSKEALQAMLAAVEAEARKGSIVEMLLKTTLEQDITTAVKQYREVKANEPAAYDFREGELNTLGYRLLEMKKVEEAIEIFKLNVEMYPDSSNPYDSLGEAYLAIGDTAQAIKNYKRSVELDPNNTHGIAVLRKLGAIP